MKPTCDVAVIGGGVLGVSIACFLARRGVRVELIERGGIGGAPPTGTSGALVRLHHTDSPQVLLAMRSLAVFEQWADAVGGECGFRRTGFLLLTGQEDAAALRHNVERLRALGADTRLVSPEEIRDIEPACRIEDLAAGAYEPRSGYADPHRTVQSFARAAVAAGTRIKEGVEAVRLVTHGDRVTGVLTTDGEVPAGAVVVACGVWARALLAPLGIDAPVRLKRAMFHRVAWPKGYDHEHVTIIDLLQGSYFRPMPERTTLAGVPGDEWDLEPEAVPPTVPATFAAAARRALAHRLPALCKALPYGGRSGFDGYTPDRRLILGKAPSHEGLYLAIGGSGGAFKIAPAVGLGLAELIVDAEPRAFDLGPYRLQRFTEGQLIHGQYEYSKPV